MASIILAQILGVLFLILGVSFLINKKDSTLAIANILENKGILWITGFVTLFIGTMVLVLNDTNIIISILGILMIIKGFVMLAFQDFANRIYKRFLTPGMITFSGIACIIIALVLILIGFSY